MPSTTSVKVGTFGAKFRGRLGVFKRGVLIKLFGAVIYDTPVDTGRLRGNWKFSVGSAGMIPEAQLDLFDATGANTARKITDGVTSQVDEKDGTYNLSNSLPYVGRIEYEGWSHTKAPQGMVRKNLTRIANILRIQAATDSAATVASFSAEATRSTATGYVTRGKK